jgi:hypothetical protein
MARRPKSWHLKSRKAWFVTLGGIQHRKTLKGNSWFAVVQTSPNICPLDVYPLRI